jgi:hypothetical protein
VAVIKRVATACFPTYNTKKCKEIKNMISIELDIFSGMPNPVWVLTEKEEQELINRVMADTTLTEPPKTVGGLGYRGFTVIANEETKSRFSKLELPSKFYLSGQKSVELENSLLNSTEASKSTFDEVLQVAKDSIYSTSEIWRQYWATNTDDSILATPKDSSYEPTTDSDKPDIPIEANQKVAANQESYAAACGPVVNFSNTNFSFWNDSYSVTRNNCYNFASSYRSNTFAQPGRKSGLAITSLSNCNNTRGYVSYNAAYDGYRTACWSGNEVYGALVIWSNYDYHWYRYNTGGYWGHKPGSTPARNYDNSGRLITNPQTCNRGGYNLFCGYRYFPYGWTVA